MNASKPMTVETAKKAIESKDRLYRYRVDRAFSKIADNVQWLDDFLEACGRYVSREPDNAKRGAEAFRYVQDAYKAFFWRLCLISDDYASDVKTFDEIMKVAEETYRAAVANGAQTHAS